MTTPTPPEMKLSDETTAYVVHPPNFIKDGQVYLVRCPKCNKENYAPAVASGQCVWCGLTLKVQSK